MKKFFSIIGTATISTMYAAEMVITKRGPLLPRLNFENFDVGPEAIKLSLFTGVNAYLGPDALTIVPLTPAQTPISPTDNVGKVFQVIKAATCDKATARLLQTVAIIKHVINTIDDVSSLQGLENLATIATNQHWKIIAECLRAASQEHGQLTPKAIGQLRKHVKLNLQEKLKSFEPQLRALAQTAETTLTLFDHE